MSKSEVTDKEISMVGPILQRLAWADKETRAKVQQFGVNVLPINFYSNTPSIEEIDSSFEYGVDQPPYSNPQVFGRERFKQTLERMIEFSKEFSPPLDGDETHCERFFWNNGQFGQSDAMAYYCLIRMVRPSTIVEIGSGFSTLVALEAIEQNGTGNVHCIEPFPRDFIKKNNRISLHSVKAQAINAEFLNDVLRDNDILFIDSTHTVKTGSDCLHIYLRLLPEIKRNIYVHVHDVFLPFGMPREWLLHLQIFWTEQYLLYAFLIDNSKATVLYGGQYNVLWNAGLMENLMAGKCTIQGGSLWFKYNGNSHIHVNPR